MFSPTLIPALAKAHALVSKHANVKYLDGGEDIMTGTIRGYEGNPLNVELASVRILGSFSERVIPLVEVAQMIERGEFAERTYGEVLR